MCHLKAYKVSVSLPFFKMRIKHEMIFYLCLN